MIKEVSVRYGQNYKVVLAIILPGLLIIPFVFLMQVWKSSDELKNWMIVFGFLVLLIAFILWLAFRVYPPTKLSIIENEVSLSFHRFALLSPSDFSFKISDITSFSRNEMGGIEYLQVETINPKRKFQLSSSSDSFEDIFEFNKAMQMIEELRNANIQSIR